MTQTLSTPATTTAAITATVSAPRPNTRTLLAGAAVAGPLFLALGVIQGFTRAGFSFTRNAISQLSLGELGWIQVGSFLLTGALLVAGSFGLRRALAGAVGGRWTPRLVLVFGASFLLAGVFKADPGAGFPAGTPTAPTGAASISWHGTIHMLSGMVGFLALCAAFFVLARHLSAAGQRAWAVASRTVAVTVLVGFVASGTAVLFFTCAAALGLLWLTALTTRLTRGQ